MYEKERIDAVKLAKSAGEKVLELYKKGAGVTYKNKKEPLTEADLASNEIVLAGLKENYPDDFILSEECKDNLDRLSSRRVWIIDPLDGTQEFVDRVDQFVVMIGLAVDGEPVVGAVYQPTTGQCWSASKGNGATLEEADGRTRTLQVSDRASGDNLRMVITRSHPFDGIEEIQTALDLSDIAQIGSVGLKAGAITTDDADLYVHVSKYTKEWDSCAPHAILKEAGGLMTDLDGNELTYNNENVFNSGGILATNQAVHDDALNAVRPVARSAGLIE